MRTLTSTQSRQLQLANRSVHYRVRADRGSGDFVDLTNLEDRSFVESIEYGEDYNKPVLTAIVKLHREFYDLSLSPLHDTSKLNTSGAPVSIGNKIIIETATLGEDQFPISSDWNEVFRGEIDELELGPPIMTLRCLGKGGKLVARFAEDQQVFPVHTDPGNDQMEEVIQDIADYHHEARVDTAAIVTWPGGLTATLSDTSDLNVGDFVGIRGTSAFFPIASIVANTSFTFTNPQNRAVPTATTISQRIPAADRRTLYSPNGTTSVPYATIDDTGFTLNQFKNDKESLLPYMRRSALLIGWELAYRWQEDAAAFELQLFGPERALSARGALTFTGVPTNGQTFALNGVTYTAVTSGASGNEWNIGGTAADNASAVGAMIRSSAQNQTVFAWPDPDDADSVIFDWGTIGSAGNSITFTEGLSNATADGGGFLGATRAGSDGPTTPDFTFSKDDYDNVSSLKISRKDVRNVIRVTFTDPTTNERVTVIRIDEASIAKYGRLYAEFAEDATKGIDTIPEAVAFADAALSDLREPDMVQVVTQDYFWPAEVSDTYTYPANGRHYTSDQNAVGRFDQAPPDIER